MSRWRTGIAVVLAGYPAFRYSRERHAWLSLVAVFWALLVVDMIIKVGCWPIASLRSQRRPSAPLFSLVVDSR